MDSDPYISHLQFISNHTEEYLSLLEEWVCIDSRTYHLPGLDEMIGRLMDSFRRLAPEAEVINLPDQIVTGHGGETEERRFGRTLRLTKTLEAPLKILLCGHMDTVQGPVTRTKNAMRPGDGRLWGTGATDAKGGLVVMLAALDAFERSPYAPGIGWEVLIVPDEEVGSGGSRFLLEQAAKGCDLGLIFEPAHDDGALVGERMGSGIFSVTFHGRSAHAGRDIYKGINAIDAMADFIVAMRGLKTGEDQVRINVGAVEGRGPLNVVPDLARCRFNIRVRTAEAMEAVRQGLDRIAARIGQQEGLSLEINGGFTRPPKTLTPEIRYLLEKCASCGRDLGLDLHWRWSGGVCDGNTLLAAGLPNVDSLGPFGKGIHTKEEYAWEDSIPERAQLVALFLMKLGAKEISWPPVL